MTQNKQPLILIILDGWGEAPPSKYNAISQANKPFWDSIQNQPRTLLETSGAAVGLPDGQMGNSEVGHMTIGCGRVILQDLPMIDAAIKSGEMSDKLSQVSANKVHLIGLISDGGVHSHMRHIAKMAEILQQKGKQIYIHAICDGRDTPPKSAEKLLTEFSQMLGDNGRICSLSGRYYAMDRDKRWERTQEYLDCLGGNSNNCHPSEGWDPANKKMDSSIRWNDINLCNSFNSWQEAISNAYQDNLSDEFIKPCIIGEFTPIAADDAVILCNFRADRMRQIADKLRNRGKSRYMLTSYAAELENDYVTLFPPQDLRESLGEIIANNGMKQLRIAETEKYPHVSFFFSGGREEPFAGEDRIMIPSPKVATYDLQPEMSAMEVADAVVEKMGKYDFILINFANADMVGHSGDLAAAIKAIETLDGCLAMIYQKAKKIGAKILITADHGNAEQMYDEENGQLHTQHTTNLVPFITLNCGNIKLRNGGSLADIAPTILQMMGINVPKVMSGESLFNLKCHPRSLA